MRLSLLKAAHAVVRWSHVQEIRVASGVRGLNMIFFECFFYPSLDLLVDDAKAVVGLRPSSSSQVRWGEGHPSLH